MSIKSLIQGFILLIIFLLVGIVYYKYFSINSKIIEETSISDTTNLKQIQELEEKLYNLELKNNELIQKLDVKNNELKISDVQKEKTNINDLNKNSLKNTNKKIYKETSINKQSVEKKKKEKIKNLVKDVEYTSVDQKGNKFYLLANSAKSNVDNNDILDLDNVRGKITSDIRDTIYIVSDYAQYNSINLNSKFYENVIINYQDKQITCINFDINMEINKAIAYNDVIITDPKSTMKAGIVEFDLKTKDININPTSSTEEIRLITK